MQSELDKLRAAARALENAREDLTTAVIRSRQAGSTWSAIARVLGVTMQAVHKRYAHLDTSIEDLPLSDPIFDPLFIQPK